MEDMIGKMVVVRSFTRDGDSFIVARGRVLDFVVDSLGMLSYIKLMDGKIMSVLAIPAGAIVQEIPE